MTDQNNTTAPTDDPVERGLREWHALKDRAAAAEIEAKEARSEAEYYRGQAEELRRQNIESENIIHNLRGRLAESDAHMSAFAVQVIAGLNNLRGRQEKVIGQQPAQAQIAAPVVSDQVIDDGLAALAKKFGPNGGGHGA